MDGEEAGRCSSQGDAKLQVLQMSEEGVACLKSVSCILKPNFFLYLANSYDGVVTSYITGLKS